MFGIGERLSRSWRLLQATWNLLQKDKELTAFPAISGFLVLVVSLVFFGIFVLFLAANPGLLRAVQESSSQSESAKNSASTVLYGVGLVWTFIYYFVMAFIINYLAAALIGAIMMRLDGKNPTIGDGFRIASEHLSAITGFSLMAATVGVIASLIRGDKTDGNIVASIIRSLLADLVQAAWNIITFLAIPVIVAENVGPIEAVKRSFALLKKTYGEQIIGGIGLSLIMGLINFVVVIVTGALATLFTSARFTPGAVVTVVIGVIALVVISVIGATLDGIFKAAVYHYAQTGEVPGGFENDMVEGAFKPKRGLAGA